MPRERHLPETPAEIARVLTRLRRLRGELARHFEVGGLKGLVTFVALQRTLSERLGHPVDLVTRDAPKEPVRRRMQAEVVAA